MPKQYYAGLYQDDKGKVVKVVDDVDCLPCDMLAQPGAIRMDDSATCKVSTMINWGFELAGQFGCHHLEIDCEKGNGSYQWLRY